MPRTPKRSALPLPRYTRRKWLRAEGKWGYFFDLPSWARKDPACRLHNEPLGNDYAAAIRKVEDVLLPLFDSWRSCSAADIVPKAEAGPGTFNWLVVEYKRHKALHGQGCQDAEKLRLWPGTRPLPRPEGWPPVR